MANMMRYTYLRDSRGRFKNPYDHGLRKNCSDFLIKGYNDDVQRAAVEDTGMVSMSRNGNSTQNNGPSSTNRIGHQHSSQCCNQNHGKHDISNDTPSGLGLGLGRGYPRRNMPSVV